MITFAVNDNANRTDYYPGDPIHGTYTLYIGDGHRGVSGLFGKDVTFVEVANMLRRLAARLETL